jgi:tellurite resistance protein TerC
MKAELIRWGGFHVLVIFLLMLDLGVFHRRHHIIRLKEAIGWSIFWIAISLLFNGYIYAYVGKTEALEFFTGYLVEKSLSVDNIFIFLLIFTYFEVPHKEQHRVLFHGIIAAIIMRLILILAGASLLHSFEWVKYFFGLFIAYTGFKLMVQKQQKFAPERNPVVRFARRHMRFTDAYSEDRFFVIKKGIRYATPLFLVLLVVESTDLVFALDSVPAILAITTDKFIVYTSNVFAILGLRSLYFVVFKFMKLFRYLKIGLGTILIYIGLKMGISSYFPIPLGISLGVVALILTISVIYSIRKR